MSDTRFVNQRMVGSSVIPDEAIPLIEGENRINPFPIRQINQSRIGHLGP